MLTKTLQRVSNLRPLTSEESRIVANHIFEALKLLPRHRHTKGVNPNDCDNCVMIRHLVAAFKTFRKFGE